METIIKAHIKSMEVTRKTSSLPIVDVTEFTTILEIDGHYPSTSATINELIAELEAVRAEHGDIEVSIDNQERCLGEDDMLWIDPTLRYWQYEEDRWGRQHRAYAKTGTPILIL